MSFPVITFHQELLLIAGASAEPLVKLPAAPKDKRVFSHMVIQV